MSSPVDWTNPAEMVSPFFSVAECCWLPSWKQLAVPTPPQAANLILLCQLLEKVRAFAGAPIRVHCMLRPPAYNASVGGAANSAHMDGLACDFDVQGLSCDDAKQAFLPQLEGWGCRMEANPPGSGWVHLDLRPVGSARYFIP